MSNAKTEYIHLSLKKISHKKWEYFLISRILHRLDDFEIEFVSQQLVRCTDATWALIPTVAWFDSGDSQAC